MRSLILITLVSCASYTGYLVGYNAAFDIGKLIGKLDSKFCFLHNGVKE